jgi:hypothetical protein
MLLQKAYGALPAGGALIVYERMIDDERRASRAGMLSSLNMLIMTAGGFDFTAAQCISWMRDAGFELMQTELLVDDHVMVVATKPQLAGVVSSRIPKQDRGRGVPERGDFVHQSMMPAPRYLGS